MEKRENDLYPALAKAIYLAASIFLLFWFFHSIALVLVFFTTALILGIAFNAPIVWLEKRSVPRLLGTLLVGAAVFATVYLLAWMVVPRLTREAAAVYDSLPRYSAALSERLSRLLADYPQVRAQLRMDEALLENLWPWLRVFLTGVGLMSLSLVGLLLFVLLLGSTVLFMLLKPRPLLENYLMVWPRPYRDLAARAFARGSQSVVGWLWSNVLVGAIEGAASFFFLTLMGVPGALLWGVFTFFSEQVPKLGPYLMSIPPVLVAFALDPTKALWVLLFYVVLNQVTGDLIAPFIRANTMKLHPVSLLFAVLAMASAFGILGALIATPLVGFVKAYYDEFYLLRQPEDPKNAERVERMLVRRVD